MTKMRKMYCIKCNKYRISRTAKISYILKKTVLSITCSTCGNKDEKYLKKKNQLKY